MMAEGEGFEQSEPNQQDVGLQGALPNREVVASQAASQKAVKNCPKLSELAKAWPKLPAAYWNTHIASHPYFNSECECLVVFILNTRRRIKGHYLVSIGTMDTILCHPREVFRLAIMASASAIIIAHNHPSGESTPSEADIKITRDLIRAGQLLKIEVLDHIVIGNPNHSSLRSLGYFYS